jgi:hypothetical protein
MTSAILARLADATPEEMIESLERLHSEGLIDKAQAADVYTAARRAQMVAAARRGVCNSMEWVLVATLDGEGHSAAHGPHGGPAAREHFQEALDELIETVKVATRKTWRIEERGDT